MTLAPKQAGNGEEGTLRVPRPLREDTGRNASEARCSAVKPVRSNTVAGSAETLPRMSKPGLRDSRYVRVVYRSLSHLGERFAIVSPAALAEAKST